MSRFVHDMLVAFRRSLTMTLQNPVWMLVSLMQPLLYLALFGPLLISVAQTPGFPEGDAWQVFVPGLLVQLGIFGASFVGFGIIAEWRQGVIDRLLVTPASRMAILSGTVLRDVVVVMVQGLALVSAAYLFGLRVPPLALVAGLLLVGMLGGTFAFLSYAAGLWLKAENALAPLINSIALPVLLLSGILLPMSLAPGWLQLISDINPFKHVVTGLRAVFRGEIFSAPAALAFGVAVVLIVISAEIGRRVFEGMTK